MKSTLPIYNSIEEFLLCPTPTAWLEKAKSSIEILLVDHAHCELKAASTALSLIFKYPQYQSMCIALSKLAREELLHYEKVMRIMKKRGIAFKHLSAARYASCLLKHQRPQEPEKIVDVLIIASIIEARSCERFMALLPLLDEELSQFYHSLVKSEARHFNSYLKFAAQISDTPIAERITYLLEKEKALIESSDQDFRFHSGVI